MSIKRKYLGITYKLVSSTEPRLSKVLLAIKHVDSNLPKRPRIQKELSPLEIFESNLQRQIRDYKLNK